MRQFISLTRGFLLTGILLFVMFAISAQPVHAQTTVTGTLSFVWGDPQPGDANPRYYGWIVLPTGDSLELDFAMSEPSVLVAAMQLSGQQVEVVLDATPPASADVTARRQLFRASARQLRSLTRQAVDANAMAPALVAPPWAVLTRPYAILLCKFADNPAEPRTPSRQLEQYSTVFGGAGQYFNEVSNGRLSLAGTTAFGWYSLPKPHSEYEVNSPTFGLSVNLGLLQQDCIAAANMDVDFSQFGGIALHFNGSLGCCAFGGSTTVTVDGPARIVPTTWMPIGSGSGVIWHELGHSFGLPHSGGPYGRTYDSRWDVMSSSGGGISLSTDFGRGGAHFIGYHKDRIGLIPLDRKIEVASGTRSIQLASHAASPTGTQAVYVFVPIRGGRPGFGYTVEARTRTGYDRLIPAAAVLINSIHPGRAEPAWIVDSDGNGNPNDVGAAWTVGEQFEDAVSGIRITVDSATATGFGITVVNGAGEMPTLDHAGLSVERDLGDNTWYMDSVRVLRGTWSARAVRELPWLRLENNSGIAGSFLRFSTRGSVARPGRNFDEISVEDALGQRALFAVELGATGTRMEPRLDREVKHRTVPPGFSYCDSVRVLLPSSFGNAGWIATRTNRIRLGLGAPGCPAGNVAQITSAGEQTFRFLHFSPTVAGTSFVDTVSVVVAGSPTTLYFVSISEAATPPVVILSKTSGTRSATFGQLFVAPDSVSVLVTPSAPNPTWFASRARSTTILGNTIGTSGTRLTWWSDAIQLGTIADNFFVCEAFLSTCSFYRDTLIVTDAPSELRARRIDRNSSKGFVLGSGMRNDSAAVELIGVAAQTLTWNASASSRIALHSAGAFVATASGTGSKYLKWTYRTTQLKPGTYIDTITVVVDGLPGSPARIIDTLILLPPETIVGDVDRDASIGSGDALIVLRSLVGLGLPAGAVLSPNGDANCDNSVGALDAMLILQLDLGVQPANSCLGRRPVMAGGPTPASIPGGDKAPPKAIPSGKGGVWRE